MAEHAKLSPSASHRWLNCTPSAQLEEGVPNEGSEFTREGTLAHAYCAKALKEMLGQDASMEDKEIAELYDEYVTDEMAGHVESYFTIVSDKYEEAKSRVKDSQLIVERKLDFSNWVPGSFGTADAIIITDGTMEVIDFKYGKGVEVNARDNSQMMIYALGALAEFEDEYNVQNVRMTIVQPRLDNLSEFEMEANELKIWANFTLMPRAEKAMKGEGPQNPGEWCRFCRVKGQCKALAGQCIGDFERLDGRLLEPEDYSEILPKLPAMKQWIEAVTDKSLRLAMSGTDIPGYKVVEGRSIRKITDVEGAVSVLVGKGFERDNLFKEPALKGLGDLEGIVGKKLLATLLKGYIVKPQGKPTLVELSDKRQPLTAASDFEGIDHFDEE